jgi:sulfoacetaldehyde dehydrogenase
MPVTFSPHPRSKGTTFEMVRVMREALRRQGAPADLFQCIEHQHPRHAVFDGAVRSPPSQPAVSRWCAQRTSSGKPADGVGAGNSTMVIDETADVDIAARNTRTSEDVWDFGLRPPGRWQYFD